MAEIVFGEGDQPTFDQQSQWMKEDFPKLPEYMITGTAAWGVKVQGEAFGAQAEPMGGTDLDRRQG